MTTRYTCGSWWPGPPERWEGLRERAWSVYRKWAATASQEDLALRAAGTLEPVDTILDLHYFSAIKSIIIKVFIISDPVFLEYLWLAFVCMYLHSLVTSVYNSLQPLPNWIEKACTWTKDSQETTHAFTEMLRIITLNKLKYFLNGRSVPLPF